MPQLELAVNPGSALSTTTLNAPEPVTTDRPALGALSWCGRFSAVT